MIETIFFLVLAGLIMSPDSAQAQAMQHRDHEHESGRSNGAAVEIPLAPVVGKAISSAGVAESRALQPCTQGWPVSPIFSPGAAQAWVSQQVQAACVISAAETALAGKLTSKVWSSPDAVQYAADRLATGLDYDRMRKACPAPAPSSVTIVYGDLVKAQVGSVSYECDATGVKISRDGATFFGDGRIDGRDYKVSLERNSGTRDKTSVGGAFLSP
jgi:hypothetical protein